MDGSNGTKPAVGIFGLTGCAGDQLQILNCEEQLLDLAERLDIVDWVMARSINDHHRRLDVAFVEGVITYVERNTTLQKSIWHSSLPVTFTAGTRAPWLNNCI